MRAPARMNNGRAGHEEITMIEVKRNRFVDWLAPVFLLALVAVFLVAPFSFKGKLDAICYGI